MRNVIAAIFLWCASVLPTTADERMLPYIEWITENSTLEYNGEELPTIEYISYGMLQIIVYGDSKVAEAEYKGIQLPVIAAAYDKRVIYFEEGKDPYAWENRPALVHELVHFLQEVNGITSDCPGELEPQAYELHDKWIVENNHEEERPNMLFVYMLTMGCRPWPP